MLLLAALALGELIKFIVVVVLVLAVLYVFYWMINKLAPEPVKTPLTVIVVGLTALALIYYAATFFGVL